MIYILSFELLDMHGKTKYGEIDDAGILMIFISPWTKWECVLLSI